MAGRLRHHLVTVPDDGSHGLYGQNSCVTAKVDEYLVDGVLPGPWSLCAGAPRPEDAGEQPPGVHSGRTRISAGRRSPPRPPRSSGRSRPPRRPGRLPRGPGRMPRR
ncbi:alpha/beta hydrolase [Crossiella sp. CA-258035]|uniref:alpha/beta hydrolase n=1 Tax=Crossiella sp. CA-258035 TaxID=2981138 RepID=UPI0024BC15C4|nr:alpha/beta hydrolase [Crossiella sp. CA-258035]WHT15647.1 alpha/beta hydrolase [Crossiella sp. CA-258035]